MSAVLAARTQQMRDARAANRAADARQYATPDDHEPDYLGYYEQHIDAWLADPETTECIGEALGRDAEAARLLRRLLTELDDRICGRAPEGDLIADMRATIRGLGARAALLAWQPLCEDMDYEARQHADRLKQMRRYKEVIE